MFESITADPGQEGLTKASRIFYVIAVLITLSTTLLVVVALSAGQGVSPVVLGVNLLLAGAAVATGKGIENARPWAKWVGILLGKGAGGARREGDLQSRRRRRNGRTFNMSGPTRWPLTFGGRFPSSLMRGELE